ncbi:calcium-activated chloride channel regulator 4A, partial [Biomphalaria glabrata]
ILTDVGIVSSNNAYNGTFYVDSTIGVETSLTFSFTELIEVSVKGPKVVYTADRFQKNFYLDKSSKVLRVSIPGEAD